jgi:thiamine pyrophosphokinase
VRALVLTGGGGVPKTMLLEELAKAGLVVCADSGAVHLAAIGRKPDLLVGDMDSIEAGLLLEFEAAGVETIHVSAEKDETDTRLAMDEAISRGASELVLLGALGGRVDHTMGNLMLLVYTAKRGIKAVIRDASCEITAATGAVEISGNVGDTVSLLPAGDGVTVRYLDGLRYGTREPLPLPIDSPIGVSNVMTANTANVIINGWAYIIQNGKV